MRSGQSDSRERGGPRSERDDGYHFAAWAIVLQLPQPLRENQFVIFGVELEALGQLELHLEVVVRVRVTADGALDGGRRCGTCAR